MPGRAIANAFASQNLRKSVSSLAAPLSTLWPASISQAASTSAKASSSPSTSLSPPSSSDGGKKGTYSDLQYSLQINGNPTRVWSNYVSLLNSIGFQKLPLELHQEVLRKCTPSHQKLRTAMARRLSAGNVPLNPHVNEGRFQTVIRNIRAGGHIPSLDDYHFVLSQFAATGHFTGSHQVYRELLHLGRIPTSKTIGLCFQAIAHRFSLPIYKNERQATVDQSHRFFAELVADMRRFNIQLTSVNMDLSLRILKVNLDLEGLEALLRWAYGVDLSYPDKAPLEIIEQTRSPPTAAGLKAPHVPLPFSLAALNTTIDILGRLGNISKMVQAFEVLTQPLPRAQDHFFSSFDEDEDDAGAISSLAPSFEPPYVTPNTTTYTILMRHVCQANHGTFARHYLNETMRLDRQVDMKLRQYLHRSPANVVLEEIPAPRFMINRGMILPVLGHTNRRKNFGLMKWLATKMPKIIRKKQGDLKFYTAQRERLEAYHASLRAAKGSANSALDVREQPPAVGTSAPTPPSRPQPLDLDVNSTAPPSPPIQKHLDLDLHIRILERDIEGLEHLTEYLEDLLGRTSQRVKERLGRRVWAGKDIWMADSRTRLVVSRQDWNDIVGFKPRKSKSLLFATPTRRGGLKSATWARGDFFDKSSSWVSPGSYFSTAFSGLRVSSSGLANTPVSVYGKRSS